jgi:hypothetical protein
VKTYLSVALTLALLALVPASAFAVLETEPNDNKTQANLIALPAVNTPAAITGNSTSAAGVGLDYFRVTTAAQATPGFYRHRLIIQSATVGHTGTIRGLSQTDGVINTTSDIAFLTSTATTTPPRFVQWYTDGGAREIFVRITGVAATTADYTLDYEVQPVTEVAGPLNAPMGLTITSEGQTTVDTDLWVYDAARAAIPDFGNDDTFGGTTLQSTLTRTYMPGPYHLGISSFQMGNNLASPPDDDFRNGNVLDFPGNIANSVTTLNQDVDVLIGTTPVTLLKAGPFDVVFASFTVIVPVELLDFNVE